MDLLITVLSLLAALYAVMPRVMQLSLAVKLTLQMKLFLGLVLLATVYLSYYKFFEYLGWAFPSNRWLEGLNPSNAVPLLLLIALAIVTIRINYGSLPSRQIHRFAELARNLLWSRSMTDLVALIDKNIDALFDILNQDNWHTALRARLVPSCSFESVLIRPHGSRDEPDLRYLYARRQIARLLPNNEQDQAAASEIANIILLSPAFVNALASMRPYLGITILQRCTPTFEREKFLDIYISALMSNADSVFYTEVAATEAVQRERFHICASSRLLRYLLVDVAVAESLNVYRPVGKFVVEHVKTFKVNVDNDLNNTAFRSFDRVDIARSCISTALHFFDIMIREAFAQGMAWHMWLSYVQFLVEAMVENYCPKRPFDPESEFPIRYSWLIYNAFTIQEDWIKLVEDAPVDQENAVFVDGNGDQSNIPRSAIVALARCLYATTTSDALEEKFKALLANSVFRLYFRLCELPIRKAYAFALLEKIVTGGLSYTAQSPTYLSTLRAILLDELPEYQMSHRNEDVAALQSALSGRG